MGYDVHITRADHWTESERRPIAAEEWLALVERDSELAIAGCNRESGCALFAGIIVEPLAARQIVPAEIELLHRCPSSISQTPARVSR